MSGQDPQEHTYVKVLYDFQYKTAESREISIKKNERLYLLQKTNADWWQVVRTWEQRSFYVPATYVRELSKTPRKNSDEDRDGLFEPPDGPKYKSMPKETHSSAMKNVKKWLAGAMETKQESSKNSYVDESYKHNAMDYQSRAELKVGLAAIKSKSLERDKKYGHSIDQSEKDCTRERKRSKEALKKLPEECETTKLTKSFSTSPKSFDLTTRLEMSLDPFRKELESSLDRRRKISDNTDFDKLIRENIEDSKNRRIRTRSSRSDDSQIDSDYDDKFDRKKIDKLPDEISRRRNSRSMELEAHQFQRTERSLSPKPTYGRQLTIAGQITDDNDEDDHRILNDKRRTWAVEELMSELTQMCKERGNNKKPQIQLKSTEIKATFDPLDKLTQELHEMNRLKAETQAAEIKSSSPINVCKISINTVDRIDEEKQTSSIHIDDDEQSNISELSDISTENSQIKQTKNRRNSPKAFTFKKNEVIVSTAATTKPLKSPKSPKILDEYNEANILNDCSPNESLDDVKSLSNDKQSRYRETRQSSPEAEKPCYSNVKLQKCEKVKMRPKLKIKTNESSAELKLTPSLEKLASEIKFQPAKRTSDITEGKMSESMSDEGHFDDSGIQEGVDRSDDSWSRLDNPEPTRNYSKFKHRLEYTGSFKTKREGKYFRRKEEDTDDDDDVVKNDWRCGLKKSSTMHCATVPDCARRFRRDNSFSKASSRSYKRRSRSLSDLRCLEEDEDDFSSKDVKIDKPVPLPRTKLPVKLDKVDKVIVPVPRRINKRDDALSEDDVWVPRRDFSLGSTKMTSDINIESSTAVGFKTLLCTSDSGSDNCLQSKELLSSNDNLVDDHGGIRIIGKLGSGGAARKEEVKARESLSDELVLSSNASSEALQSQSESEVTAAFDASSQPSPVNARNDQDSYECAIDLPPGWTQKYDPLTEQICFVNEQGDRWFSSNDAEGKIYFFEENSNESSWVLPTVTPEKIQSKSTIKIDDKAERNSISINDISLIKNTSSTSLQVNSSFTNRDLPSKKSGTSLSDWPQLFDGNMRVLKEGIISRTKITENGKKLRKNWSTSYAVLTELFLLFFKDAKTFTTMMKSGQSSSMAKPDISVDLNGALIEPGERASSRKNVYMIDTVLGLQVLIQSDNTSLAAEWYQEIHGVIRKLPSSVRSQPKPFAGVIPEIRKTSNTKSPAESNQSEDSKRSSKISRSRSMKMKRLDDSLEDLSGTVAERQTKIKAKLRRFFQRRPTVESLVKNGIYKDEPAFGSYLADVCPPDYPRVPLFVKTCIEVLESNEDNMKTDGLYRASGNLSQIQKIRLQVDQYNLNVLSQEEDVHVLTGALKLFFRELKEPLIPSVFFNQALSASMRKKTAEKIQCFRDIVKALPPPNHDTLQFLLRHLLKVTSYQEYNRMHIPNLAIVFGPTLMWPAEESANMALDLMQQNLVIECLLSEYNKIFK